MNFNNSSSTLSLQQTLSINDRSTLASVFVRYKFLFLIILSLLILLLLILICILKHIRKNKKKILRRKPVIKRRFGSKPDTFDDPHITLLKQNCDGMINNIRISSNDKITNTFLTDPTLPDTPKAPKRSISSQYISTTNSISETTDNDLSDLDLTNIPLRRMKLSNTNLTNSLLSENTNCSSYKSSENPYIVEFKQQEKEKAKARKEFISTQTSTGSKISEESCL